ncbi:hypothetical protein PsorP6_002928 [Peronosclerospora sorghi]|uniref:Uncharacterized protein n=1 Tax=Peronosclerospora sorghi TaxID=230839 RepID=A0ACC0VQY0_9STRA|nr:hypothetical protein PsorP6_002928 [Peronosclerospora sorghi]
MNQMRKFGRKGPSVSESKPSAEAKRQEPSSIEKRKTKVLASVASASAAGEDDESPKPKTRRLRAFNKSSEKSDTASSTKGSSASKPKFRKPGVGTQVVHSVESTASKDREEIKLTSSRRSQPITADSSEHRIEVDMTGTEVINQARAMRMFSRL